MKVVFVTICLLLLFAFDTKAAFTEASTKAGEILSAADQWKQFNALDALLHLNRKEYEQLTGRHLNLVERIGLKLAQHRLRKELQQHEATGILPQKMLDSYWSPRKGSGATTVLLVVLVVLLLLLLIPLVVIGKWK